MRETLSGFGFSGGGGRKYEILSVRAVRSQGGWEIGEDMLCVDGLFRSAFFSFFFLFFSWTRVCRSDQGEDMHTTFSCGIRYESYKWTMQCV